jgi:hypothetical protein
VYVAKVDAFPGSKSPTLWVSGVRRLIRSTPGPGEIKSSDESRNVWQLSLISFGESWHNNHYAFPSSAFHGLRRFEAASTWAAG